MAHDDPRQKLIALVKEQLAQEQSKLAETEARIAQLQEELAQLQKSVTFFKDHLAGLMGDEAESAPTETSGGNNELSIITQKANQDGGQTTSSTVSEDEDIEDQDPEEDEDSEDGNKRNPKQMLRPQYKKGTLGDAAKTSLDKHRTPLTAEYIAKLIFEQGSPDENERAKNSLSTELRRGAKEGRWKKVGRGLFESNSVDIA